MTQEKATQFLIPGTKRLLEIINCILKLGNLSGEVTVKNSQRLGYENFHIKGTMKKHMIYVELA